MSVPPPPTVQGTWSPERELMESMPRRLAPSDYPDYNKPNAIAFMGLGIALLVVGILIYILSLLNKDNAKDILLIIGGIVFVLAGLALVVLFPVRMKTHRERTEHLAESGIPVMGRIAKVENMTGDSIYGRQITYMITLPGDNFESRREVKGDDRAIPKTIPGPATVLVDFQTKDCELYCAMPFKAVSKYAEAGVKEPEPSPLDGLPMQTPTPTTTRPNPGGLGTMGTMEPTPIKPEDKPKQEEKPKAAVKLPWET